MIDGTLLYSADFLVTGTLGLAFPETKAAMLELKAASQPLIMARLVDVNWRSLSAVCVCVCVRARARARNRAIEPFDPFVHQWSNKLTSWHMRGLMPLWLLVKAAASGSLEASYP